MNGSISPGESILLQLWRDNYPFLYWANRINKINPLNEHDEMEAVFTLLQLSDTYVTNLVAILRNPNEPWYFVKERTYREHVTETLNQFKTSGEEEIDLRNFHNELDDIVSFHPHEDWEEQVSPLDVFIKNLLGCPTTIDEEKNELTFLEDPDDYIDVCNGVVNFSENYRHLLNDLKHGFRLLPFEWESIEGIENMYLSDDPGFDLDEKKQEYESTKGDYVYFWRLEGKAEREPDKEDADSGDYVPIGVQLNVYRIELRVCTQLSRTINLLLHNLIRTEPVPIVEELEPLIDESGQVKTFELFLPSYLVAEA